MNNDKTVNIVKKLSLLRGLKSGKVINIFLFTTRLGILILSSPLFIIMYTLPVIQQKCVDLRERMERLEMESSMLLVEITENIYIDINTCLGKIGELENKLAKDYIGKYLGTKGSLNHCYIWLENEVDRLVRQVNGVKFFSTYRDWVNIFINAIIDNIGEKIWRKANNAFGCLMKNLSLTDEEHECIEELAGLLKKIDMTLNDIKLLHEVKSKSNIMFYRKNQDLRAAKNQINDPIPDEVTIYKPPIKMKMLEKIDSLRSLQNNLIHSIEDLI